MYKDEIEKVLSDETLTTNEEKVEAIAKSLATLVIPKDKFNDVNNKLKATESNLSTLSTEYEEFKKSRMTDDEKAQAEREELNQKAKNLTIKENEYAVRDLFESANISKEKYEKILGKVVSENKEKTIEVANTFIELLNETKVETQKQTTTELLNGTPKPNVGNPNAGKTSKLEALQTQYAEAIKSKDVIAQTRLLREIQEEQNKKTI